MRHYATGKSECDRRNNVANIFHQLVLNNERLRLGLKQGLNKPIRACSVHPGLFRLTESGACSDTDHVLRCLRSEEHTSELQSLMRISYAVFCLKKKKKQ